MTLSDAIETVRNALENRPRGFVAVAIDVEVLETLLVAARIRQSRRKPSHRPDSSSPADQETGNSRE